jgi:hypothetical protein
LSNENHMIHRVKIRHRKYARFVRILLWRHSKNVGEDLVQYHG